MRDAMFYPGSAPHGGGKSLHPAPLILIMVMLTITRVHLATSISELLIRMSKLIKLVPLGVPCPSLYKLEGRVTCGVLVGLGLL